MEGADGGTEQEAGENSENMESDIHLDDSSEDDSFSSKNEDVIKKEKYFATFYVKQCYRYRTDYPKGR